jgi:hypothetical protein
MKKHLNKILIFVINVLLTVIGVLLIKDYNRSQTDIASSADPFLEPLSGGNADSQIINEAIDLPVESVVPVNNTQNSQSVPSQAVSSPSKNTQPASKTPSSNVSKSTSKTSSSSSNSSISISTKKSSTPKTKTS